MLKTKRYILLFILQLFFFANYGQDRKKVPITEVLDKISTLHRITFNYESNLLKDVKVIPVLDTITLSQKIDNLQNQTNLVFNRASEFIITIYKPVTLCGYVVDKYSQQPLSGATINGKSLYTISDEDGYFEIELKSLKEVVSIRFMGFKTLEQNVDQFNLNQCETIHMLEDVEEINSVLLQAYIIKGIEKKEDWTIAIDYDKFSLLPGLIESDVLKTVQALPSILSVDETVSNINIRGGSNDQNLMLWDDIKMYQTGHFFGLISSFNPYMTQTANVINNGTDTSYTDGVSGTILMQTENEISSKFKGIFGLNFLNAELFTDIPISEKSSLQFASRKSLDGLVRSPTYKVYFDRVTQETEAENNVSNVTNSDQEFNFYDASLRWLYKLSKKDNIRLNFILINNDLSFNETANRDGSISTRKSSVSQSSLAFGLNYKRNWSTKLFSTLSLYNSDYNLQSKNADVLSEQLFLQENKVSETGIKLENIFKKDNWQYKLGYNFSETEVVNLNDIDLPRFLRRDEEVLREHAAFAQVNHANIKKDFSIRLGIRANYISKFKKLIIEPRLSVRKTISKNLEIEALGEFKHQNISQIVNFQNDFLGIEKRRWQLTDNDTIPIMESKQVSLGVLYKNNGWLLDTKAYYKTVEGITTQSQSFTTKYEFAKEKGSYNTYGLELLIRKKINSISSWLSYSYINNTYTFEGLEDVEFPSNFDITHAVAMGSTYSNEFWSISAGVNYRAGKPTSIPLSGAEIVDGDVNFDKANADRLKDYLRIDASALYKLKINKRYKSEIGASLWNISNRKNTINHYYRICLLYTSDAADE